MNKKVRIGIMGFGRIGRNLFRLGYKNPLFDFAVISDLGEAESMHYLLMRDSVYGKMTEDVTLESNYLKVRHQNTRLLEGGKPGSIPWDAFDIDFVIDATGRYRHVSDLQANIDEGAKRVIVTVPPVENVDRIIIAGINENTIEANDKLISVTTSTTQVLALMIKMLDEKFGVERAMMTSIHAYTSDQPLADAIGTDLRRSRSAVENIIPNSNASARIVGELMPKFKGKLAGIALNVPVPDGSCVDLSTELENMPAVDELNSAIKSYADGELKGIVGYTDDPIVSSDVVGTGETMIFDGKATMLTQERLLKTICWYDSGWGFSKRILELIEAYSKLEVQE
ncbi:MAG: glyceraldehyde 3-phosphate dehydrogenase NAD-binding domain-containing protein [Candidatus Neomarinimicrobiota bacterium]